jgi:hypothetical protein
MAKAMLKYLKNKRSQLRIAAGQFQWQGSKKGAKGEKKFSTYGMGM